MPLIGIGTSVNHLTRLLSALPLPNTITITSEPDAGTLTTATAGQTHAELLALIDEGAATTDGPGSVTITATLLGDSTDPVQSGQSITGVYLLYTATEAPSVPRNIVFDPAITVPVPVPAPVITGLPTISGVERVGELLTATPASVTNGGTLTWQWFAGGVAISGATSSTFSLTLTQEGTAITVQQTQTNDTGADTATSVATGAIVHVAPTASNALADQSFTIGTGVQTYAAAGDFTGEELSYSLNTITGVTINAATGVVSFDTGAMALQASTSIVVTASNSGGSVNSGFGVSITAVAFAFTDNADGTLDVTTEGTAPTPIVVNNGDGTATTDEAGAYIYKPSANAEDDFSGAVGSNTLSTTTGVGTFKVYKRIASSVAVTAATVDLGSFYTFASNGFPGSNIPNSSADDTVTADVGVATVGRRIYVGLTGRIGSASEPTLKIDGVDAIPLSPANKDGVIGVRVFYLDSDTIGGSVSIVSSGYTLRREVAYQIYSVENGGTVTEAKAIGPDPASTTIDVAQGGAIIGFAQVYDRGTDPTWVGATPKPPQEIANFAGQSCSAIQTDMNAETARPVSVSIAGTVSDVALTFISIAPA